MSRKPRPAYRLGVGILNPYGDMWTPEVFHDEEEAKAHFYRVWRGIKDAPDWSQYRVVRVRQRTSYIGEIKQEPR